MRQRAAQFWEKHKNRITELALYGFFGVLTTVANVGIYHGLLLCSVDYKISNLAALIISKLLAYLCNKRYVFRSRCANFGELCKEFLRFLLARGFTGLLDYFGLIFAVEVLHLSKVYSKYVLQVIVITLNYILGKTTVFKNARRDPPAENDREEKK